MTAAVVDLPALFPDVKPVPQDDGPEPVCAISYPTRFVEAFDYFRAVSRLDERSERALQLTEVCLRLNPANYTVWHYRRRCLAALSSPPPPLCPSGSRAAAVVPIDADRIESDLTFAKELGGDNPKNYQIWYHRRALLESRFASAEADTEEERGEEESKKVKIATGELEYVDCVLENDSKNYHSWSHRQWILRTVNADVLWNREMEYCTSRIRSDVRNNSAWNQRWFTAHRPGGGSGVGGISSAMTVKVVRAEAEYALRGAAADRFNESPWRYLVGVLMEQRRVAGDADSIAETTSLLDEYVTKVRDMKQTFDGLTSDDAPGSSACLMSALVDLLEAKGDDTSLTEACGLVDELKEEDPVRKKYWHKRKNSILMLSDSAK